MTRITATRALLALVIIVLGNLQAWDSDVPSAGLWIVLLVSLATALPAVALLVPLRQSWFLAVFALSFLLLLISPGRFSNYAAWSLSCPHTCCHGAHIHWHG